MLHIRLLLQEVAELLVIYLNVVTKPVDYNLHSIYRKFIGSPLTPVPGYFVILP